MADFDPENIKKAADQLMKVASSLEGGEQEAAWRAATNRYYYACFMSIYQRCGLDGDSYKQYPHEKVSRKLSKAGTYDRMIGNDLIDLKQLRVNADYYLSLPHTEKNAQMADARASKILKYLDRMNPNTLLD